MKLLLLLLLSVSSAIGYKILCINPAPSKSHSTLAKGIVDSLLRAGHEVTWVTAFTDWKPHPKLTFIEVATKELAQSKDMLKSNKEVGISFVREFGANISIVANSNKKLREVLVKEQFDAVVTEWFFSETDAGYAAIQQVPWILLSPMPLFPNVELQVDELRSVSTIPIIFNEDAVIPMTFVQRLLNTFMCTMMFIDDWINHSKIVARYESFFSDLAAARGVPLPPFRDASNNVSILFVNSHPSITPPMSLPPNVIDIAGYHIEDAQPLPEEIKSILDGSPQGVVYFSMGSVVKSALIPEHTRRDLIEMLGALPHTVLWKFEEEIKGLPKNIIVKKWWPQPSVLAHPNVKLFITHGGLLSTLEAVHYGVPLLAVPVFGDQPSNAARAVRSGYAKAVPYSEHMGPELKIALNEMLRVDKYYKQAKYLSKIFNNRPVHPSKLVSHYIELAIESKGAYHLRSVTHQYHWIQRWMLDQIAALLAVLYAIYSILKKVFRKITKKEKEPKKKSKKN